VFSLKCFHSTSLSNGERLAAHPKFVWVFNANCDGTVIYNDPVYGSADASLHKNFYVTDCVLFSS
jgi:hypothetical protein